jgi:nucleotidyltransferase substrate binding protein (TIGR01987 family)
MENNPDIRWIQRLDNYSRALSQFRKFMSKGELNELEEQGLIQAFEYTHELAWNVLKDYLQAQGYQAIHGSRDATRKAFNLEIIQDGTTWMDMIKDRNQTSHTYNQDTAHRISTHIKERFFPLFIAFEITMQALQQDD